MRVLTVNAGSSSLKLRVLDGTEVIASDDAGPDAIDDTLRDLLQRSGPVAGVGHRVVHGGSRHIAPELVDDALVADLEALTPLAPLHQPAALAGITAARTVLPGVPSVACFDTAFHHDLPVASATYAVPVAWRERFGLRRFGAHGLSYAYASRRVVELVPDARRVVVAHVGSGASVCAVLDGRSVDTTMGFTPSGGVVMSTRSGDLDPGMLLWLQSHGGLSVEEVLDGVDRHGGLTGLAGTGDVRELEQRTDDPTVRAALDVYVHRLASAVASMTVSLGGLEVLVLTGGVAERSAWVRAHLARRLAHLGVRLDEAREVPTDADTEVTGEGATVRSLVLHAREDVELARAVLDLTGHSTGRPPVTSIRAPEMSLPSSQASST